MRIPFLLTAAAALMLIAAPARSETIVSPHVGGVFGGDLEDTRLSYGATLGFLGDSLGFEVEGAYTPDFFGSDGFSETNLTTLMGNILLGTRFGDSGRLFATAGGGLLRTRVDDVDDFFDASSNDFGVNAGVGAMGFFSSNLGVRGDIRYFRNLSDPNPDNDFDVDFGDLSYWRGTAGIVFKF